MGHFQHRLLELGTRHIDQRQIFYFSFMRACHVPSNVLLVFSTNQIKEKPYLKFKSYFFPLYLIVVRYQANLKHKVFLSTFI